MDTINTTMVVVLFCIFVYDMLIKYKTWAHQCLKKQVKSHIIVSCPFHPPKRGLGGVTCIIFGTRITILYACICVC